MKRAWKDPSPYFVIFVRLKRSSLASFHRIAGIAARFDPTFAADLTGGGFVGLFLGLKAQASCCRAFSPSDRAEGPTARSTGLQPCVRRCRETRPERLPARFDPSTFAADLSGRGFVGRFLGLKAQASCCRAFSPSDRAEGPTARSTGLQPCG